jgi:hypothetical protein
VRGPVHVAVVAVVARWQTRYVALAVAAHVHEASPPDVVAVRAVTQWLPERRCRTSVHEPSSGSYRRPE